MKTLRPFGVTFTPKPARPRSQYTRSVAGVGNASMAPLVNLISGIADSCSAVLPSAHIGSTRNEMTGPKGDTRSALEQAESMRYEPPGINFHPWVRGAREP